MEQTRDHNATGCFVHPGVFTFHPIYVCMCMHQCVCVTVVEVKQGNQLKIIGTNFINSATRGNIYLISHNHRTNLCSTSPLQPAWCSREEEEEKYKEVEKREKGRMEKGNMQAKFKK